MILDKYKEENRIEYSEDIFGIDHAPEYQCDNIDYCVQQSQKTESNIEDIYNFVKTSVDEDTIDATDYSFILDKLEDLDSFNELDEVHLRLEDIRSAIEECRLWGDNWKVLCKTIFNTLFKLNSEFKLITKDGKEVSLQEFIDFIDF